MVEGNIVPPALIMTYSAICCRVEFVADKAFVLILMTINAIKTNIPEAPFILLLMALKTWSGRMSTLQLERSEVMLFSCISELRKAIHIMAFCTIGRDPVNGKLFLMVIRVTVFTTCEFKRICKFSFMASFAIYRLVFAFQFKIRFVMIELFTSFHYEE
jgi:hypothetical protein